MSTSNWFQTIWHVCRVHPVCEVFIVSPAFAPSSPMLLPEMSSSRTLARQHPRREHQGEKDLKSYIKVKTSSSQSEPQTSSFGDRACCTFGPGHDRSWQLAVIFDRRSMPLRRSWHRPRAHESPDSPRHSVQGGAPILQLFNVPNVPKLMQSICK